MIRKLASESSPELVIIMVCLRIICLSLALAMVTCENTLVTFQKENYIVKGGCPSKDPDVIK